MNKLSLILLVWLFSISPAFAQFYNHLHTYDSTSDVARNILLRSDNTLFVSGSFNMSETDSPADAMWMNISSDGTTVLDKGHVHNDSLAFWNNYCGNIKRLPNGGILMPYSVSIPFLNGIGRYWDWAGLIVLDPLLDTVFTQLYTDTSLYAEAVNDCDMLPDGSFLVAGTQHSSYASQQDTAKGMLIKILPNGTMLWKKTYTQQNVLGNSLQSVQPLDNDRTLIGGTSSDSITTNGMFYYRERPWFLVINNSDGSVIKDTTYTMGYMYGSAVYKDMNGGYYHTGYKDSVASNNSLDPSNFPSYIAHLDTNFNINWITSFPYGQQSHTSGIWRPRQLQNGDYLVCGIGYSPLNPNHSKGWAARISSTGAILWSNYYLNDIWTGNFYDFVERPDGSIVLCGQARKDSVYDWQLHDVWLLGIDANGNILSENTFVPNKGFKSISIDIYPNPNKGEFFLQTAEDGVAELYDMSGRLLESYDIKQGKSNIQVRKGIAAGNYLLQFTGAESGLMAGQRLLIE